MDSQQASAKQDLTKQNVTHSNQNLSPLSHAVVNVFETKEPLNYDPKIAVNRFVSELASWYEKLRNAMDLQDGDVILKNAIERILKRRLLLGGNGQKAAEPLLRELVWARYFPDNYLPENYTHKVAHIIDLYLELRHKILAKNKQWEKILNEWIPQLMSCQIATFLSPNKEKEAMSNFMYHIAKESLVIEDESLDTKNVQVYIAVRRAFAKDDIAFLRFHLFSQIFPAVTTQNLDLITDSFVAGYREIKKQLTYKLKEKIYVYVKKQTPIFFILEDVFRTHKGLIKHLIADEDKFGNVVLDACSKKYDSIKSKVRNAIIRSVFFLLLTKVFIAFAVEGSYDKVTYGHIIWVSLILNIVAPPLFMVIASFFIKTPDINNSRRIFAKIKSVLFDEHPKSSYRLTLFINPKKGNSVMSIIFTSLWIFTFGLSFYLMILALTKLHFNPVSQGVFIFFITIVSFLSYRINLTANSYTVDAGQGLLTPFIDILLFPIIRVGMHLTDGISQINILIFIFDFLIEAPFKVIFSFFEQLFSYLHSKREDLV